MALNLKDTRLLEAALIGLRAQRREIDEQIAEVEIALGRRQSAAGESTVVKKKRVLSEEGRRRIAEAARNRWADARKSGKRKSTKRAAKKAAKASEPAQS
jgi:hypothetical protein